MGQYIKDIQVVYTKKAEEKPSEVVEEVDGLNPDINAGFGGEFVYLVPVWTSNSAEAANGIDLVITETANDEFGGRDLAKGAGGWYRYLTMVRDKPEFGSLTKAALWRTTDAGSLPSKKGWTNWTGDINYHRKGDYLYLAYECQ